MSQGDGLEGLDLTRRVVLLGVVELFERGETPAHAGEVRRVCLDALDAVDAEVVGTPTEAEVARSLNELEAAAIVEGSRDDTSATGKGRPAFGLAADADEVLSTLAADDRIEPVVSRIESSF